MRLRALFASAIVIAVQLYAQALEHKAGSASPELAQYPHAVSADYTAHNFHFDTGEQLADMRLHYITLGQPHRNAKGHVDNAVVILHATISSAAEFLKPSFTGVLFGPGQLLDAGTHYIILPDSIGAGESSRPSDGMHMRFPKYGYGDMVRAQHLLLTEGLGVDHARLILGTSMGCMHTFLWGELYPEFADALMPIACLPVEVAGRNRIARTMVVNAILNDPNFQGGEYKTEPMYGLRMADEIKTIMVASPLQMQKEGPTAAQADQYFTGLIDRDLQHLDANNFVYLFSASRDYNPFSKLASIQVPLTLLNSADDFIDPAELHIAEKTIPMIPKGRYVLLPITEQTRGHSTFALPALWQGQLKELLERSAPRP